MIPLEELNVEFPFRVAARPQVLTREQKDPRFRRIPLMDV